MITYGNALAWCVQHHAVFRFVNRRERGEFYAANMDITGQYALELAVTRYGKTVAGHMPLDASKSPADAVAVALIGCVEWFEKQRWERLVVGGGVN